MMSRVLVLYATKHGSAQEVAEAVATAVRASGADVHLMPAGSVRPPLVGWDLVVLGAPLYSGWWHRDAHRFLRRHRTELASVSVAVFGVGPRRDDEDAWQRSHAQVDRALARRAWLVPVAVAVAVFGGADPVRRNRVLRRDLRDWTEIGNWARKVLALAVNED